MSGLRTSDKLMDLATAVDRFVHDGDCVALEGFGQLIPFAAGHEIIRQNKRDLNAARMTPDLLSAQMLAAGGITKLVASCFARGSAGSLYELLDLVKYHDHDPLK